LGRNRPKVRLASKILKMVGEEKSIRKIKGETQANKIKVPNEMNEELAELLGLLLGDGSLKPKSVCFYNNDEDLLHRVEKLIRKIFKIKTKREYASTVKSIRVNSKALRDLIAGLGFPEKKKSTNCSIPEKIMKSEESVSASFLRGYYLADGSFNKYEVEISTSSKEMSEDLVYELTKIGVTPRLSEKETQVSKNYRVRISGKELKEFYEKTSTKHRKYDEIEKYLQNQKIIYRIRCSKSFA